MKVLLIGVNGFSGAHLLRFLSLTGDLEIFGTGTKPEYTGDGTLEKYIPLDITRYQDVRKVIEEVQPAQVYNMAGILPGVRNDQEDLMLRINCLGCINILEAVKSINVKIKTLFVGSAAEYGRINTGDYPADFPIEESYPCNPVGFYGISKYYMSKIALDYFQKWNVQAVVARPFNIIGPGVGFEVVAGAFLKRAWAALKTQSPAEVKMGDLGAERDFMDVRDVARALRLIMELGRPGEVYNVASGVPVKIEYIIETLRGFFEGRVQLTKDESIKKSFDVSRVYGSSKKLTAETGFLPEISLEDSLYETWKYERESQKK